MRLKLGSFSRYRPRVLTLVFLAGIAAAIVLANLSEEYSSRKFDPAALRSPPPELEFDLGEPLAVGRALAVLTNMSYGWPLVWHQYVIHAGTPFSPTAAVVGENYSAARLAGNGAIWLAMMGLPAAACEWLLRRWRPRFRFSLRSMLVVVALAAAMCGWFVAARERANLQDSLITAFHAKPFWVEHRGPKWLGVIGANRYRRYIVAAQLDVIADDGDDPNGEALLERLGQLSELQYLSLETNLFYPRRAEALREIRRLKTLWIGVSALTVDSGRAFGAALGGMRRLRTLTIAPATYGISDIDEGMPRECLAAIGAMDRLEHFRLEGRAIAQRDLGLLAGMANLKSLALHGIAIESDQNGSEQPLLAGFPRLPRLEVLDLSGSDVGNDDLRYLAALPKLRALNLVSTNVTGEGVADLAPAETLEELAIGIVGDAASATGLQSLKKIKNLKRLHIGGIDPNGLRSDDLRDRLRHLPDDEYDDWLRALVALRKAKPELVIDGDLKTFGWPVEKMPAKWEKPDNSAGATFAHEAVRVWKEQQAAMAANQNAAVQAAPK